MAPHRWLRTTVSGLLLAALFATLPGTASAAPSPRPAATPAVGSLDPYLPPDTAILVTINVRQILDSGVVKKHLLDKAREGLKDLDQVQAVLDELGFDPFKDLDKILVAGPGGTEKDRGLIIIRGRFDLAKFKKRGDTAARDNSDIVSVHKVPDGLGGQFLIYEVKVPMQEEETSLFVALASKNVILASPGKDYVRDALKANAGKAKGAALKSKEFATLLATMDAKQSVSFAAVGKALTKGGAELPAAVKDLLDKVDAIGGGITIGDDIKAQVVVSTKEEADAKALKKDADKALTKGLTALALLATVKPELSPALEVIKTVRVRLKGKTLTFRGAISSDVIEDAMKLVK